MQKETIEVGMFLRWDFPGGLFTSAMTRHVKVLNPQSVNMFDRESFLCYVIENDTVINIKHSNIEQLTRVDQRTQQELESVLKERASSTSLIEKIKKIIEDHDETQAIHVLK